MSALPKDESAAATVGAEDLAGGDRTDGALAPPRLVEVMCECGHLTCTGNITMSLREYEAVRRHPTRFLIKEGHEVADLVRVVSYGTGFVVVAKFDADSFS